MLRRLIATIMLAGFAAPSMAQNFTTADEVRPILDATKGSWVAVREYEGKDLLYFTHLLAWRCGLEQILYSLNGDSEARFDAEPCYEDEPQPNAIKVDDKLPYVAFDLKSIDVVSVRLVYDDGTEATTSYERAQIMTQ
ncbi:hypothetical protein SAMN05444851_1676 [Aliiroseovarius sediminilitoris]|uniref:Protease inhibitor Inh n=1 Tax=Aliiroseovarius sediminilitoris TaxID=1173584 RepID=A0A1I0PJD1_9RHOB|nr:hypothetical protein [Aliiroseovarius sediminilitoris]SEW14372.1 hypothetical protein SAMN05444851_1676 [Aliiroseovarius sediminilitoris]